LGDIHAAVAIPDAEDRRGEEGFACDEFERVAIGELGKGFRFLCWGKGGDEEKESEGGFHRENSKENQMLAGFFWYAEEGHWEYRFPVVRLL